MLNHNPTKHYCDYCGDPIPDSLIMVDGFLRYNSLSCANCTDYDELDHDQLEYAAENSLIGYATEEDYDQPYAD